MIKENVSLKNFSNYRIGGLAKNFLEFDNIDDLKNFSKSYDKHHKIFVLGGGTNILFDDKGFDGLVIKPNFDFIERDGLSLRVGSSVLVSSLLDYSINFGLSGFEWAGGLPGTIGGAVYGNAGAFGGEIKDSIVKVISFNFSNKGLEKIERNNENCDFGYRSSYFKKNKSKNNEVISEIIIELEEGNPEIIKKQIDEKIEYRLSHQPIEHPNIGSIFKNVKLENVSKKLHKEFSSVIKDDPFPLIPAAHLISEVGLRGISFGGAMVSPKHPNFIVNVLNAASDDVIKLVELIKKEVKKKFGIELKEEIEYIF